uniref:C2H2-type domain-containing protein n=1 Tax=Branchiostoma floridae TaxID=7739 RepID=C3YNC9_BRAFL|eukprot:XP_002602223.1 hypothetical protein BRAFLDRAFT_76912 [Branchiostoma floridae]
MTDLGKSQFSTPQGISVTATRYVSAEDQSEFSQVKSRTVRNVFYQSFSPSVRLAWPVRAFLIGLQEVCAPGMQVNPKTNRQRAKPVYTVNRKKTLIKYSLDQHVAKHIGEKPYTCGKCGYRAARKYDLSRHMRTHTGEKRYKCGQCDYSAAIKYNLDQHLAIHTGDKPYTCEECGYRTARRFDLSRHMRVHTGDKPYNVDRRDYSTARKETLEKHLREKHTGDKPYMCEECGYRATQKYRLSNHMKTHTREKPYKSAVKESLEKHLAKHTDEKPYLCEKCGFRTTQTFQLFRHMRTHTGEKPYKCDQCDYSAAQKTNLTNHIAAKHTGEKPYMCGVCGHRTVHKSNLTKHMRTHTGAKPYKCDLSISAPTAAAGLHAFQVVRTANQRYLGVDFFAIHARLPADGLSASENWCRDYQNLCEGFGLRPTGCGEDYAVDGGSNSDPGKVRCVTEYNSDPYISGAIGCPPSEAVSEIARSAFSVRNSARSFGLNTCTDEDNYCRRNISNSEYGLYNTRQAWPGKEDYDVYTVCKGSSAHSNGGCQHFWDGQSTCTCRTGFVLQADGRSCEAGPTALEVLRTKIQDYNGIDFLVIEARLPADGLSNFVTWCMEYKFLCADYGLRPTGCGEDYAV